MYKERHRFRRHRLGIIPIQIEPIYRLFNSIPFIILQLVSPFAQNTLDYIGTVPHSKKLACPEAGYNLLGHKPRLSHLQRIS